jgi:hypothetical protein
MYKHPHDHDLEPEEDLDILSDDELENSEK